MRSVAKDIERHPLQPFLPENARLLLLGSFPPPRERWCMPFFYPNPQNDMWRIMGQVFYGDRQHFVAQELRSREQADGRGTGRKAVFKYKEIVAFCREKGIAIFDTARAVVRLQGNAADEHLEIVEPTDIASFLRQLPLCQDVCCTGGKAADTLAAIMSGSFGEASATESPVPVPPVGGCVEVSFAGRNLRFWRMPSSSRAYPLSFDKKSAAYRRFFAELEML